MVNRLKQLSLSPRGPGALALSQIPRIDSACVKQLSCSIITTIPTSLIFLSYSAKPWMTPFPWNPMRLVRNHESEERHNHCAALNVRCMLPHLHTIKQTFLWGVCCHNALVTARPSFSCLSKRGIKYSLQSYKEIHLYARICII